ncbi:hypothetical protein [Haladaptatus salinisoli]|uniref:hypothetical protein n=1 Tax=Haladaptatus salinisoli TaxID=2884876 RepID=UPI001D0B4417|nr:hypothetical protein [Haladaptatus salinisoli]
MSRQLRWLRRNWALICVVTVLGTVSAVIDYRAGVQGGYGPALIVSALVLMVLAVLDLWTDIPF